MVARAHRRANGSAGRRSLAVACIATLAAAWGCGSDASSAPPAPELAEQHLGLPEPVPETGSRREIPPELRVFFTEDDFQRMGDPLPGDWLATQTERGQTFPNFVRSHPNRPDELRRILYLQPVGTLGPDDPPLAVLADFTRRYFALPVEILPMVEPEAIGATTRTNRYTLQPQLLAPDVLTWLGRRVPDDAYAVIALTAEDLYPEPSWNFVFGLGSFRDRVGVYSFARYNPAFYGDDLGPEEARQLILHRAIKVMAHEIGHMFGIEHCIYFECVMNGANHMEEADSRPMHLCPIELRKLWDSVGFDIRARYRALSEFYAAHDFPADAAWTRLRAEL